MDIVLLVASLGLQGLGAYLGIKLSLDPVESPEARVRYKRAFIAIVVFGLPITVAQQVRSDREQAALQKQLADLQQKADATAKGVEQVAEQTKQLPSIAVSTEESETLARERAQRQDHLQRLRPVLKMEAPTLTEISQSLPKQGYVVGGIDAQRSSKGDLGKQQEAITRMLYPDVLSSDLRHHFSDYGRRKDQLRSNLIAQERQFWVHIGHVALVLNTGYPDIDIEVAHALVRKCVGIDFGMRLTSGPWGHRLEMLGGDNTAPTQPTPPSDMQLRFRAFESYKTDSTFETGCTEIRRRMAALSKEAAALALLALTSAEQTLLNGDCEYVPAYREK